jgi:hypothetical protein
MSDTANNEKNRILGILSMVFGIVSIVLSPLPFARVLVIILAIAAIALGAIELDNIGKNLSERSAKTMAITGIVLGSVSIVVMIVSMVVFGAMSFHLFRGGHMGQFQEQLKMPGFGKLGNFKS